MLRISNDYFKRFNCGKKHLTYEDPVECLKPAQDLEQQAEEVQIQNVGKV